MKIAIISDIHENSHNLVKALEFCHKYSVEKILCLGDLINPGIAKTLASGDVPVFSIWGNNDGDKVFITKISMAPDSQLTVNDRTYAFLEEGGRKIFITHYPELAEPIAKSGDFDAVFYGHDHLKHQSRIGDCLVLNPGEISAHKTGEATFAIYDTDHNKAGIFTIQEAATLKTA
jgi:putative phosphoesterase